MLKLLTDSLKEKIEAEASGLNLIRVKKGNKLPGSELFYLDQNDVVKKIDILDLCKGKTIILGMPGAFTKTCSALHLPGYIKNYELASKKGLKEKL